MHRRAVQKEDNRLTLFMCCSAATARIEAERANNAEKLASASAFERDMLQLRVEGTQMALNARYGRILLPA